MITENSVEFELAEVLETYIKTYQWIPTDASQKIDKSTTDDLFSIRVRTYNEEEGRPFLARPCNSNIKQIPLVGEHVLVFRAINQESTTDKRRGQWYYFPAISIQSAVNNNSLPGIARNRGNDVNEVPQNIAEKPLGETFEEQVVSPLQPYEGDILIEGRFGNSIRLGSTIQLNSSATIDDIDKRYTLSPSWNGNLNSDPIIILSNGQINKKNKEFVVESFDTDQASLYLTSTQQVSDAGINLELNKHTSISEFDTSQLIGSANRIVLSAKTDSIILNGSKRISLISREGTRLGKDDASNPIVKGKELKEILADLINAILAGVVYEPAGIISTPLQKQKLLDIRAKLNNINSKNHFLDI
jgi:hypothetical protein